MKLEYSITCFYSVISKDDEMISLNKDKIENFLNIINAYY